MHSRVLLALGFAANLATPGIAAPATADCKLVQAEEWPVRIANSKLVVDGAINGEKVGVMLDTGAARTLILRPAAIRLGLDRRRARGYPMLGVGGTIDVETAVIDELRVGETTRKGLRMMVVGEQDPGDNVAVLSARISCVASTSSSISPTARCGCSWRRAAKAHRSRIGRPGR